MIIDDFHIVGITALPYEANAPLLVNSYAVLTFSAATQSLQVVRRWNTECFKEICGIYDLQLNDCCSLDCLRQLCRKSTAKELFRLFAFEGLDHIGILSKKDNIVKRYCLWPCMEIPRVNEKLIAEMAAIFKGRLIWSEGLMEIPLGISEPAKHQG
jgi:hypothetical protein